jgi:hypothetical protein
LRQGCERHIDVAIAAGVQTLEFQTERAGSRVKEIQLGFCNGIDGVDEKRHEVCCRDQLVQHFKPLRRQFYS